jgi:hypothetical protein
VRGLVQTFSNVTFAIFDHLIHISMGDLPNHLSNIHTVLLSKLRNLLRRHVHRGGLAKVNFNGHGDDSLVMNIVKALMLDEFKYNSRVETSNFRHSSSFL